MTIKLMPFTPKHTLTDDFFHTYTHIYQDYSNAPLENIGQVRYLFSAEHDFFRDGKAVIAHQSNHFRVVGLVHPGFNYGGRKAAYFGFWETKNHLDINKLCFRQIQDWAKNFEAEILVGPINFSTFGSYRIRLDASKDDAVFLGEPFSPPYYQNILTDLGFTPCETYTTTIIPHHPDLLGYFQGVAHSLSVSDWTISTLPSEQWIDQASDFYSLTADIFANNPGYAALSYNDFMRQVAVPLSRVMCPHTSVVARHKVGAIIGYVVTIPNYGELRLPTSELSFAACYNQLKNKMLIGKTVGVKPEYRGKKLQFHMTAEAGIRALSTNLYSDIAMALMRDGNHSAKVKPPLPSYDRKYALYSQLL